MSTVFIFGTGRCGSTHLQRLISLRTATWVWGEHDGVLTSLLACIRRFETSPGLDRAAFSFTDSDDSELIEYMKTNSPHLSWLNRFDRMTMRTEMGMAIDRLFSRQLPNGWIDWGFKEILYGLNNDAPDILLDVFPDAVAAFTFRDPRGTLASMLQNWTREFCRDPERKGDFVKMLRKLCTRYESILSYFLDLRNKRHKPVVFVSTEALNADPESLLGTLGLRPRRRPVERLPERTNKGAFVMSDWAKEVFESEYAVREQTLAALYARCLKQSHADFSSSPRAMAPRPAFASFSA